jgi:hypothetical protein
VIFRITTDDKSGVREPSKTEDFYSMHNVDATAGGRNDSESMIEIAMEYEYLQDTRVKVVRQKT